METIKMEKWGAIWEKPKPRGTDSEWSSEIEVGEFMYALVRMTKPRRVLEIGTFEGYTTVEISRALERNNMGVVVTVDNADYGQKEFIEKEGVPQRVEIIMNDIKSYADTQTVKSVDLIFIDDGHEYHEVMRDLAISHELIKVNGFITGHDAITHPQVVRGLNDFLDSHRGQYEKVIVSSYNGVFVLKRIA